MVMKEMSKGLEGVISQMLKPLKGLSLSIIIEGLADKKVLPFNPNDNKDKKVLEVLKKVANRVLNEVNKNGILRPRPNEVGNDIELFVKKSLQNYGYVADTPLTINGKKKSTGYPDIEFMDEFGRYHYLECKTYNIDNIKTTQRSFYLSPSNNFKVTKDAHHFGISFEIFVEKSIGNKHLYKVKGWKILDLANLELDVKYEFNSDNKRLYDDNLILAEKK
jgi:hypothetical protein